MKIWFISDTHGRHRQLKVPEVDMVIHCGDESNHPTAHNNYVELLFFLAWWGELPIKHKILVPGNHSTALERLPAAREDANKLSHLLIHDEVEVAGIRIFGSPFTPSFGTVWSYNVARSKIGRKWQQIPEDVDILCTHGPPHGVLDISEDMENRKRLIPVGCKALYKRVEKIEPDIHCFGHIHGNRYIDNAGTKTIAGLNTTFINASVVKDGVMEVFHNGYVVEYEDHKVISVTSA